MDDRAEFVSHSVNHQQFKSLRNGKKCEFSYNKDDYNT